MKAQLKDLINAAADGLATRLNTPGTKTTDVLSVHCYFRPGCGTAK
jgi:hypothetical protein